MDIALNKTFWQILDKKQKTPHFVESMAGEVGLEPTTNGFGDRDSTNWAIRLNTYVVYSNLENMSIKYAN